MSPPALDALLHQANRLRIVTALYKNRELAFTTLRDSLGMTDGNLASHLSRLETAGYVKQVRVLVGVSFELHARITDGGSQAFRSYLAALRRLLEDLDSPVISAERGAGPAGAGATSHGSA